MAQAYAEGRKIEDNHLYCAWCGKYQTFEWLQSAIFEGWKCGECGKPYCPAGG